jgi:hypothetical protein
MAVEQPSYWAHLFYLHQALQRDYAQDRELFERSAQAIRDSWRLLREITQRFPEISGYERH